MSTGPPTRTLLYLMRRSPYGSSHALEALESALVAAVFEQRVRVLFRDDGVWQLVQDQDAGALGTRTLARVATALPEYDVDDLYVCADSLRARNLTPKDLVLPAQPLDAAGQRALLLAADAVLND